MRERVGEREGQPETERERVRGRDNMEREASRERRARLLRTRLWSAGGRSTRPQGPHIPDPRSHIGNRRRPCNMHMLKVNETCQYMRYWRGDWNCGGGQAGGSLQVWCVARSSAVNVCSKQWGWDISRKQLQQAVGMGHFRNEFVFNTLREV